MASDNLYSTDDTSQYNSFVSNIKDPNTGYDASCRQNEFRVDNDRGPRWQPVTIATLPDGPLLDIFSFYVDDAYEFYDPDEVFGIKRLEAWCTLVHVCQRWRNLVFASPRRLNLRLVCTSGTPVMEMLNIWPTLPIVVQTRFCGSFSQWEDSNDVDSIIAALKHRDRVCQIDLRNVPLDQFSLFAAVLGESFPILTRLDLNTESPEFSRLHPYSLLGRSAPRLRSLTLDGVPFPELPELLLSTKDLVELHLLNVTHSGYHSPEAIVTCLSSLTSLEKISLAFAYPRSRLDGSSRRLPSLARVDLPSLIQLKLHGVNDYMEDFVSRINAPLLVHIRIIISLFDNLQLDISQFDQFIGRIGKFKLHHQARVNFDGRRGRSQFGLSADPTNGTTLNFSVSFTGSGWRLSSLAAISALSSPPFRPSSFERLELCKECAPPRHWEVVMKNTQWLQIFRPFTAVKDLYLESGLVMPVACTLRNFTGNRATEVLPALQNIFLKGGVVSFEGNTEDLLHGGLHLTVVLQVIEPFIAARQRSGCPVPVRC